MCVVRERDSDYGENASVDDDASTRLGMVNVDAKAGGIRDSLSKCPWMRTHS